MDRNELIKKLYLSGMTCAEVGRKVGLSGGGVIHQLRRMSVPRRPQGTMRPGRVEIIGEIASVELVNAKVVAIVDAADAGLVRGPRWFLEQNGYIGADIDGKRERLHRLIARPTGGLIVDHINHNKLDNRRSNLRCVTYTENGQNRSGPNSVSTTGVRGVFRSRTPGKYRVQLVKDGTVHYLGTYDSKGAAEEAAVRWRAENAPHSKDARDAALLA
jgi:hypothetical protein